MKFDLEFPLNSDGISPENLIIDSVESLFSAEADHVSCFKNLNEILPLRRDAVLLLIQAREEFDLDPFVVFLATNYIDRFLSSQTIPMDKPWIIRLLSLSCFSLACKMNNIEPSLSDFQLLDGQTFDGHTIRRMELFVLRALDWRMRSITPFSFLRFFLAFLPAVEAPLISAVKACASEIIILAQIEARLLNRKPSVAAASALLFASRSLLPQHHSPFSEAIRSCSYVCQEDLQSCCVELDEALCSTPVTVLRLHRHSSCSSDSDKGGDER